MEGLSRIQKEIKDVESDKECGVGVRVVDGDLRNLEGYLQGPKDTPYEGGIFFVNITLGQEYPFVPPKMKFTTKVWHPNVSSQSGAICLDILKDQWSPALTIKTALLSLQALLCVPQPDDPLDAVVAKQYTKDFETFQKTAKYWTEAFAQPKTDVEVKLQRLTEMGFSKEQCENALKLSSGDENAAMDILLGAS
eukprot:TRINITY_DN25784_c0_g2_i2.p2 TRINITY_DN25784_c0_g2~~TRINITY_DN25784_c0_g2_i2.p2  ORF type:complete len:194 (+),score=31.70 TRINITY_DN25784_c0_g2_i2:161-742(+)